MNFIHASDLHLGYVQYSIEERFRDYARAFQSVIKYAIDPKAECIMISSINSYTSSTYYYWAAS